MRTTTMGLVLRATKTGEADRALLLLTPDGLVSAMAKGALRLKSRLFSGTGLFCYSEFTLFEGKTMFVVDEAEVRQVFWGIHESVEHMALAMYFAELASTLSHTGQEAEAQLRLLLNSLYLLSEGRRAPRLVKAVYELRAMTLAGFMPDLVACADCEIRGRRVLLRCTEGPPVLRRMRREARAGMQFGPGGAGGHAAHRVQRG